MSSGDASPVRIEPAAEEALRAELQRLGASLRGRLERAGEDGVVLARARASGLDAILRSLHAAALAALPEAVRRRAAEVELAAVGSFGRGALALSADVDLRLLLPSARRDEDAARALADAVLYPAWDAGLQVGHQVVRPPEMLDLARTDLATATSLLDLRPLAGPPVHEPLLARARARLFEGAALASFVERLAAERASRRARFATSVYSLEPDVKLGEGGTRDLDLVRWAYGARLGTALPSFRAVADAGLLLEREALDLDAAEELLFRIRNRLHATAGRRSERLSFEAQEALALAMGFGEEGASPEDLVAVGVAVERMMQAYYRAARAVSRAVDRALAQAAPAVRRAAPAPIGEGLVADGGAVALAPGIDVRAHPRLAFRVYEEAVRRRLGVAASAREEIARAAADPAVAAALRASPEARASFLALVCTVEESPVGSIVGALHDAGLLLAMVPEFAPVVGRVHHDAYHVLTVDAHSVAAVDCLRALVRGELAELHPVATRIAAELERPRVPFVATLLHDFGKGYPDASGSRADHSRRGAELCDVVLPRLGLAADEAEEVRALVLQHLVMYRIASRRDLDDTRTISELAALVRGREALRHLYLLTVADVTTTSPSAMTAWRARMVEELYLRTDAHLAGQGPGRDDERAAARRDEAVETALPAHRARVRAFVRSMPDRYVLAHAPAAIAAHADVALARGDDRWAVGLTAPMENGVGELCVVAEDAPGLLSRVTAALASCRLDVLAAQVSTRDRPRVDTRVDTEAVDVFRFRAPEGASAERLLDAVRRALRRVLDEGVAEELLVARTREGARERRGPTVAPRVVVDDRASPTHTVVEVVAGDVPGLLHQLARALHEARLVIAFSKIHTEGNKAIDVFYVTERDGTKVRGRERLAEIHGRLHAVLGPPAADRTDRSE
jgi:[protein-PII] uridylyltransferase